MTKFSISLLTTAAALAMAPAGHGHYHQLHLPRKPERGSRMHHQPYYPVHDQLEPERV